MTRVIGVADSVPVFQAWQVELTTVTFSAGVADMPPVGIRRRIPESRALRLATAGHHARAPLHLGRSNDFPSDRRIVFAEGFIDMLSHVALFPDDQAHYRSTAGGLNPKQPELVSCCPGCPTVIF
jgi:hypothetical protein